MKRIVARAILSMALIAGTCTGAAARDSIHVSTSGNDSASGTADAPFATIEKALETVEPGGTIYVHEGTYYPVSRIVIPEKATSADARISLMAYGADNVVIDGSKMAPKTQMEFKMSRCMYFPYWANYWYIKGITFCNAKDNGVKVEGSYNIFENCVFHDNNDTGLQIGMFKDWSIEETKSFPIKGTPEYNPGYTYCRGNKVINCDSYNNYDAVSFNGKDDGGDADGFACKLFPGPGTEFYGCRAWNNSDDNWDLYMVYHPVVIDNCWAWNAALDADGKKTPGNGNGFKLGGGGSSGGAAFAQSTGAHVVRNCVAFSNTVKGFDQNNAYEGMYLFNNVAWDNEYNYRFPTAFKFGGMRIRNCVGFKPRKLNHEFLSANKEGYQTPDTDFNSWTLIDGTDPVKDGNKVDGKKISVADHSMQFISLSEADAKAPRNPDGSLPDNGFCRLVEGSIFIDKGEVTEGFVPVRFMTEAEAAQYGLELITAAPVTIEHNGEAPDLGAYESGVPTTGRLYVVSGATEQTVYAGTEIEPIVLEWGGAATDVSVSGEGSLSLTRDMDASRITISGVPSASTTVNVTTVGGDTQATVAIEITVSEIAPATLVCTTGNASQSLFYNMPIEPIVFTYGGGATGIEVTSLPAGLSYTIEGNTLTISGIPTEEGRYTVTATGGMEPVSLSGSISLETAYKILTGDWYNIQDPIDALPDDLRGVVSIESSASYTTVWNPEYTESDGSVPGGCTKGAVNVERGGAIVWRLPSLLELKANVHFTGGRYLEVRWQYDGEAEKSWTSDKLSKTTLCGWDLMSAAGISETDKPVTVKFVNPTSNNGGIRVYDFFAKVHADSETSIHSIETAGADALKYFITASAVVIENPAEIAGAALFALDGRMLSSTTSSAILPRPSGRPGVYILQVVTCDGKSLVRKAVLK
ncbi:MAG: right-handed parallel beta-helix repeat-containing protein [Muribaculaceae bacterium]|nr:right-handed parallel beta-helix repeat-containing protein [Muribaculaceae bacterium]